MAGLFHKSAAYLLACLGRIVARPESDTLAVAATLSLPLAAYVTFAVENVIDPTFVSNMLHCWVNIHARDDCHALATGEH